MNKKQQKADHRWRTGTINKEEIETLQRYGIDRNDYGYQKDDDEGSHLKGDWDDMRQELATRAMGDYDTRRTFEASAMAGDKKSRKYAEGGFNDATDVVSGYQHMRDLKKEHVGGGGMRGAKNIAGLTQAMVDHDRNTFIEQNDDKYASQDDLENFEPIDNGPTWNDSKNGEELSTEISEAKERVKAWQDYNLSGEGPYA